MDSLVIVTEKESVPVKFTFGVYTQVPSRFTLEKPLVGGVLSVYVSTPSVGLTDSIEPVTGRFL
ncbi:putative hypothetical protein [Clostridium botulinum BKT015925]|nr:putative hypothetical protein [Clostridium botulinum BKT015925]